MFSIAFITNARFQWPSPTHAGLFPPCAEKARSKKRRLDTQSPRKQIKIAGQSDKEKE
jgi:hypothetical protein